ncbi:amidase signature domain-containing protein [Clohesyomyces aquaticus]|uniref:Amidase signature domain-containing protein n=1 Tax=Clohesyomyces aquaticus TaxID=1231657 RepID=A0A1Y1Y4P5_9PLEO|nr:amidase signature domain-containing protein [Clohesyomyces aquaticus]
MTSGTEKAHKKATTGQNQLGKPSPTTITLLSLATVMVSFMYLKTGLVAFGAITSLVCGYPKCGNATLPLLIEATTEELAAGLMARQFTSVDLVNAYIARILEMNSTLHMVTEINPDALNIAKELDAERRAGKSRGPLHGIPILIKNNIATADSMNNTAGSFALLGAKVPLDATVAAKLRKAGAIILGKTNLSQWANFRSSNSSNGWSAYGGQTYAAYYPGQDPSGSSSGSGVASSLGLALACLGTETDGSIVSPSEKNNLVGIKPTVGLTSRALVIPISEHQDTVGPMARTVKDAAYLLQAIAGPDPADNYTLASPFNDTLPDYVGACKFDALKGKRIGVPRNNVGPATLTSAPVIAAFELALKILEGAGAIIVDNTNYTAWDQYLESYAEGYVLDADFVVNLKHYLDQLTYNPTGVSDLESVQNFTQHFAAEEWPSRDTKGWGEALGLNFTQDSPTFWKYYQEDLYLGGTGGLLGALKNYSLDAVVLPTQGASGISAIIGGPVVTVPLGAYPANTTVRMNSRGTLNATAPNVPFGISFAGAHWSEADLIGFAYAFEQRTLVRDQIKPYIQPTTELADVIGK